MLIWEMMLCSRLGCVVSDACLGCQFVIDQSLQIQLRMPKQRALSCSSDRKMLHCHLESDE